MPIGKKPTQLPEELGMYVDGLRKRCPAIDEVWLVGPRANRLESRGTDWELLAFGDADVLEKVRATPALHRDDLNLMVVTDGDCFESAWGDPRPGRLSDMRWRLEDPQSATYVESASAGPGEHGTPAAAIRVR